MSIDQLYIEEVFLAADMKMMRMLIGCQPSAACKCFCPMCLATTNDALPGHIHAPILLSHILLTDSMLINRFLLAPLNHNMIITMHS